MSMDEEVWTQRLEKFAIGSAVLSMFSCLGIEGGYNVTLAMFAVYSSYSRNGRINFVSMCLLALSLIIDITYFSLDGKDWSYAGRQFVFGLVMGILNIFVKVLIIVIHYMLFNEFGGMFGVSFPAGGASSGYTSSSGARGFSNDYSASSSSGSYQSSSGAPAGPPQTGPTGYQGISDHAAI